MPPVKLPKNANDKARANKGTLKRLLSLLLKKYKLPIIVSLICLFFAAFSGTISSIFIKNLTDIIERSIRLKDTGYNPWSLDLPVLFASLGGLYLIGITSSFIWNRTMAITTHKFLNDLREELFAKMQSLPIKYFDTHHHGDIMSIYTNDIDTIRQLISQALPALFQTFLAVMALLFVMLSYSVWLTIIVLLGAVFMMLNTKFIGGKSAKFFVRQQRALGKVEGSIQESMKGLKVIKVFCHEEKSVEEFAKLNNELRNEATTANIFGNIMMPIMGNIGYILYVLLAVFGSTIIITGMPNITIFGITNTTEIPGIIFSFLMMSRVFTNNVSNFSNQVTFIVMAMAGASRVFELIDEKPEEDNGYVTLVNIKYNEDGTFEETNEHTREYAWKHPHGDGTLTYHELKGDITLTEVDFAYVENKLVLENVSIYARPGEKIAFVGATGAGKTTITNLINRFYDIADGKIRYDGININKIKKPDLRRSLGIVLQDTNLFTGTVRENIRYGNLEATEEEIINAAKIANAYDFITRLPEGFDTMLTGDGANLSQGQRQLLSIARAAVKDAPVMILDEATSSIDTRTEKLVQSGMDKLMEGRTTFVIAHRLSTVQNSEAIMVLDHGHIIERGTHDDLIKQKGVYYQLYTGAFELE